MMTTNDSANNEIKRMIPWVCFVIAIGFGIHRDNGHDAQLRAFHRFTITTAAEVQRISETRWSREDEIRMWHLLQKENPELVVPKVPPPYYQPANLRAPK